MSLVRGLFFFKKEVATKNDEKFTCESDGVEEKYAGQRA